MHVIAFSKYSQIQSFLLTSGRLEHQRPVRPRIVRGTLLGWLWHELQIDHLNLRSDCYFEIYGNGIREVA